MKWEYSFDIKLDTIVINLKGLQREDLSLIKPQHNIISIKSGIEKKNIFIVKSIFNKVLKLKYFLLNLNSHPSD